LGAERRFAGLKRRSNGMNRNPAWRDWNGCDLLMFQIERRNPSSVSVFNDWIRWAIVSARRS